MIRATIDLSNPQEEGTAHYATLKVLRESTFDSGHYSGMVSRAGSDTDEGKVIPRSPLGRPSPKPRVSHPEEMHAGSLEDNLDPSISYS